MQDNLGMANHVTACDLVYGCASKTTDRRYIIYQLIVAWGPLDCKRCRVGPQTTIIYHSSIKQYTTNRRTGYIRTLIHVLSLVIRDQSS